MKNPYADMMKMWSEFPKAMPNMSSMSSCMPNMSMPNMSMPNVDMSQYMAANRRNMEAATAICQVVADGVKAVSRRQAELARNNVETLFKTAQGMLVNGSPEINTSKQAELAKCLFENSLNSLREVSELCAKSGFEAFDVMNRRATECLEECNALARSNA